MKARRKREMDQGREQTHTYPNERGCKTAKNLSKNELGGVIFGCKNHTIAECLSRQLFGLPIQHMNFVKKIKTGLTLFLFNYTDRKLHGIYEATCPGGLNIDPYAWTNGRNMETEFPAQVRINVRLHHQPLTEEQFKSVISDNYYAPGKFWFELNHAQTEGLIQLFLNSNKPNHNIIELKDTAKIIADYEKAMGVNYSHMDAPISDNNGISQSFPEQHFPGNNMENGEVRAQYQHTPYVPRYINEENELPGNTSDSVERENIISSDNLNGNSELLESIKELKEKTAMLETKQLESESNMEELRSSVKNSAVEIQQLNHTIKELKLRLMQSQSSEGEIYLIGGYNGKSWLSSLDSFSPSKDILMPRGKMNSVRGYATSAVLGDSVYVFGGGDGMSWFSSVECYNPRKDSWTLSSPLACDKGSLAGASLNDKIYALGGGNGSECFSDVEMFVPSMGKWIYHQPMLEKRFASAAAVLHGTLYVTGGYDGKNYLQTAEKLDPREGYWSKAPNMNARKGCHSISVFNDKIYAMGGFNGQKMTTSVEYFDPRNESWIECAPLNHLRGYANAAVVGGSLFIMSGVDDDDNIVQSVECFSEVTGWVECNNKAIGKRCFFSAISPP